MFRLELRNTPIYRLKEVLPMKKSTLILCLASALSFSAFTVSAECVKDQSSSDSLYAKRMKIEKMYNKAVDDPSVSDREFKLISDAGEKFEHAWSVALDAEDVVYQLCLLKKDI
tara:strand:- start:36696 stop:37037 length:342 start_codon:yes stop_codon:yes gene_type:complete